jgi:hypothetical protein
VDWRIDVVRLLTGFVLGMVATVLLGAAGVYTYFKRGMAPVAASAPGSEPGQAGANAPPVQ